MICHNEVDRRQSVDRQYFIGEEESERINIIKFISIIFVLFIHSYSTTLNFADNKGNMEISSWLLKYQVCCFAGDVRMWCTIIFLDFCHFIFFGRSKIFYSAKN